LISLVTIFMICIPALGQEQTKDAALFSIENLKDNSSYVRTLYVEALWRTDDPRAVEPLILALKDNDSSVRHLAGQALADIGKPAVEALVLALKDNDSNVRYSVVEALAGIGDNRAVEPLIQAQKDNEGLVRFFVVDALGKINDTRAGTV
jgi:HEAT repeat protein